MSGATPLPRVGDVFLDARGEDRALRLSRHAGSGLVILSLWKGGVCTGTFRLPDTDLHVLLGALTALTEVTEVTELAESAEPCAAVRPAHASGREELAVQAEQPVQAEQAVRSEQAVRGRHRASARPSPAPDRLVFPITDEHPRLPSTS